MSPEQARARELDSRTDLFSFGAVLYEMATGTVPFRGGSTAIIFDAILNRAAPSPLRLNPDLPSRLEDIINRAMEKDRNMRYQHAADMRAELQRLKRDLEVERGSAVAATKSGPPVSGSGKVAAATVLATTASEAGESGAARSSAAAGQPMSRRMPWAGVGIVAAFMLAAGGYYVLHRTSSAIDSLAVLPIANATSNSEMDYLADGITEGVINDLSRLPGLRVMARSTVSPAKLGSIRGGIG
jgi:hypothetical protein